MNRINAKEIFVQLRNGLAFCFSWLVVCVMFMAWINGRESIQIDLLFKLLVFCFWSVVCFILCFQTTIIRKKGFIFRLTLFYVLFIPTEIVLFWSTGIINDRGSIIQWIIFGGIVLGFYGVCVLIDQIVCRKQGVYYTEQLLAYNERRTHEQQDSIAKE